MKTRSKQMISKNPDQQSLPPNISPSPLPTWLHNASVPPSLPAAPCAAHAAGWTWKARPQRPRHGPDPLRRRLTCKAGGALILGVQAYWKVTTQALLEGYILGLISNRRVPELYAKNAFGVWNIHVIFI